MTTLRCTDLNVDYFPNFGGDQKESDIFQQLYRLPFKSHQFNIRGRGYTPLRKMCAYGDDKLVYAFSGVAIEAQEWTPLLRKLKQAVEEKVGCEFNYALLNLYETGYARINAHRDGEKSLDPDAPIACLSFGSERKIIFRRPDFNPVELQLESGSLYVMNAPTNRYWTHEIPSDISVKAPRISITFRKLKTTCKRKQMCNDNESEDFFLIPNNDTVMTSNMKNFEETHTAHHEIGGNVCLYAKIMDNDDVAIHIRKRKIIGFESFPTEEGITMSRRTWLDFTHKFADFDLIYNKSSFIANNSLMVCSRDREMHLQEVQFDEKFKFGTGAITLSWYQHDQLNEKLRDFHNELLEMMFVHYLPRKIMNARKSSFATVPNGTTEDALKELVSAIELNLRNPVAEIFKCMGCIVDSPSQLNHDCLYTPLGDKFKTLAEDVLILVNLSSVAQHLKDSKNEHLSIKNFYYEHVTPKKLKALLFASEENNTLEM